jgi:catechol 1,2-dioxygenase
MTTTTNGTAAAKPRYDPDFTASVLKATGPNANPRSAEVIGSLITHLHDFAREVNLTVEEWMTGVNMINRAGQMSNERRNEGQLLCDVIGLESYVFWTQFLGLSMLTLGLGWSTRSQTSCS